MNNSELRQINYVMDWFDFEKVKRVMDMLRWKWAMFDGPARVPELGEIKAQAKNMLENCMRDGGGHSTGGFTVNSRKGILTLSFVVADWDGYGWNE